MSELVRSAEPVGKLVRRRARDRSIFAIPEQYRRGLSSKDASFKPAVEVSWLYSMNDAVAGLSVAVVVIDVAAALFVGLPWSLGDGRGTAGIFWSVYGAAQGVLWPIPGVFSISPARGRRRNFKALVDWMGARYGIQLSSKQGLMDLIAGTSSETKMTTFTDVTGQVLTLSGTAEKGYEVYRKDAQNEWEEYPLTAAAKAPQVKTQAASQLPEKLRAEHGEILRLIAKLNQRELSPESDHVVNRAERDIEKVLTLHGDLQELGVVDDSQVQNVKRVLKQLRAELTDVLQRETNWALNQLSIETTYVTSREEPAGIKVKK